MGSGVPRPGGQRHGIAETRRLIARLRDVPPPGAASPVYNLVATAFHLTAGLIAVGVAWLQPQAARPVPITAIGAAIILMGIVDARYRRRLPEPARRSAIFAAPVMVAGLVLLAGNNPAGEALFWLFAFVPIRAFLFFPWRWAVPMSAWAGLVSGVVVLGFGHMDAAEWLAATAIGTVSTIAVSWLVYYAADAEWDPHTDMLNRMGFDRELTTRCAQADAGGRLFSLAVIKVEPSGAAPADADPGGDRLARRLADRWRPATPPCAQWARIADLEFGLFWTGASAGLEQHLRTVRSAVERGRVTIGFCDYLRGSGRTEVLHAAYEGRAHSARTGRSITRAGPVEAQVEELRQALAAGLIVPHYQPIVDLRTGAIVGAEALARWQHPERGWVPPDEFIPMAEHARLVDVLGARILRQSCRDAAGWRTATGRPAGIAVNVSGCQLQDGAFPRLVRTVLAEAGLRPEQLTLEVTESTIAADDPRVHAALRRLRADGVTVAIDDFGTGYSSMARLVALPVDVLKIDREFVNQLDAGHPILQYMVALAGSIGLRSVVEGIERPDQAAAVTAYGADLAQGWLFGRPVPNRDFPLNAGSRRDETRSVPAERR